MLRSKKKKIRITISKSYILDSDEVDGAEHAKYLALKQLEKEIQNNYLCEKDFTVKIEL